MVCFLFVKRSALLLLLIGLMAFGGAQANSAFQMRLGYGKGLGLTLGAGYEVPLRQNLVLGYGAEVAPDGPGLLAASSFLPQRMPSTNLGSAPLPRAQRAMAFMRSASIIPSPPSPLLWQAKPSTAVVLGRRRGPFPPPPQGPSDGLRKVGAGACWVGPSCAGDLLEAVRGSIGPHPGLPALGNDFQSPP